MAGWLGKLAFATAWLTMLLVGASASAETAVLHNNDWPISSYPGQLNFKTPLGSPTKLTQQLHLTGPGGVPWEATTTTPSWISFDPETGSLPSSGSTTITVTVDPRELRVGEHWGSVTVSRLGTEETATTDVRLELYIREPAPPFGRFELPRDGATVSGSIPVTGWALDDTGVESVKIYRVSDSTLIYIGEATFVAGARPDVARAFPGYPKNYRAGWGYLLLTNFLPDGGNGTFSLTAVASDVDGQQTTLGTKIITCENADAVKPFGAIDTPSQAGAAAASSGYINWGWVLTPQPNTIPTDGSTIDVIVNGLTLGHPTYNIYREDIATLFPGYNNSDGAVGYFPFDTTIFADGVHTMQWRVTDDAGNTASIGTRYFTISNTDKSAGPPLAGRARTSLVAPGAGSTRVHPVLDQKSGVFIVNFGDADMIQLDLSDLFQASGGSYNGLSRRGDRYGPLPIGSNLDRANGIFNWLPGSVFNGRFEIDFSRASGGETQWITVRFRRRTHLALQIPVVAHTAGFEGTAWRSDVGAVNTGERDATIVLRYGIGDSSLSRSHLLAPGTTVEWRDVLVSLLGLDPAEASSGTLAVTADESIVMTSRTYTDQGAAGTYGQYEPALALDDSLSTGMIGVLPQIKKNARFYTNIGLVNTGPQTCWVQVRLYDATGALVADPRNAKLDVGQWRQLNDTLGELTLDTGYATVAVTSGGSAWCYASVVDSLTKDPTTIPVIVPAASLEVWVPGIAHAEGFGGTRWRSAVAAVNTAGETAELSVTFHSSGGIQSATTSLAGRSAIEWDDILVELFGVGAGEQQAGCLEISADQAVVVTARTYADTGGAGTYGQYEPALGTADMLATGTIGYLPQIRSGAGFYTNIGIINPGPGAARIEVKLFAASGVQVGSRLTRNVPGGEWSQFNKVFAQAGAGPQETAYATVQVTTAGASAWFYASVVDDLTKDPTTIPVLVE
jgi:hypothetical protein